MAEEIMCEGRNFEEEIRKYIGETVTIFTTSGGESGSGFTGVVLSVSRNMVRLITQPGSAPGSPFGYNNGGNGRFNDRGFNERGCNGREDSGREGNYDQRFRVGSVTDIPINRISAFVHNAV